MEKETVDLKAVIAQNITELRRRSGMTQLDLADRLNYTDKAVSKWERGESVPDVFVLKQISDLFAVPMDYLVTAEHGGDQPAPRVLPNGRRKRGFITLLSVLAVWLLATAVFVFASLFPNGPTEIWLSFICAIPVSLIVWLILNSIWFNRRWNYLIVSLLMWGVLLSLFLISLSFAENFWMLFLLGCPGQVIILVWAWMGKKKK